MPYLPPDLQDPRLKQPTLGQALAQGTGATAPIGVAGGGSSAGQVGPQPTPAGGGSGFVNLSQYLGANQGASDQMAQGILMPLVNDAQHATQVSNYQPPITDRSVAGMNARDQATADAVNPARAKAKEAFDIAADPTKVGAMLPGSPTEGGHGLDAYLLGAGSGLHSIQATRDRWDPYLSEKWSGPSYVNLTGDVRGKPVPGTAPAAPPPLNSPTVDSTLDGQRKPNPEPDGTYTLDGQRRPKPYANPNKIGGW